MEKQTIAYGAPTRAMPSSAMQSDNPLDQRTTKAESYLAKKQVHEQWESKYLNDDLQLFYDAAFRRIVKLLGAKPGAQILDAGCGYGYHAVRLARLGLRVVGVDFSEAALVEASKRAERDKLGDRVELRHADLLKLPYPDNSFDFINCWGVLMHVPELERALTELIRVLRPGGRLVISENNLHSLHVQIWERIVAPARRMLQQPARQIDWGQRGKEEWIVTHGGGLLVRKTNMQWLIHYLNQLGAMLICREAGQFTEIYSVLPWRPARRVIYAWNYWWFEAIRHPGPALGNILIFEKRREP